MSHELSLAVTLAPLLVTAGAACLVLLLGVFLPSRLRPVLGWLSVTALLAVAVVCAVLLPDAEGSKPVLSDMWISDRMALVFDVIIALAGAATLVVLGPFAREHGFARAELPALVLFAVAGALVVAHATHLLSLLIGIETMSLAAYALVACRPRRSEGAEGALKYFLMGALATGFFVYGMALIYGTTGGEMSLPGIAGRAAQAGGNPLFVIGVFMILAALLFKIAAVPFHMWLPDAYEGAPTPVAGFMAAAIKAAAFAGAIRLLGSALVHPDVALGHAGWARALGFVAFASMLLGNLAAIRQESVKRLLAYSSIAHAGYLLLGLVALGYGVVEARPALLFYLGTYTATTLGAFAVASWVGRQGDECLRIDDWAGMARKRPVLALAMTVFLLSLAGVPPTGGFMAKFYLFRAVVERNDLLWLVVTAVLLSVVSVYYYLRIVVAMYFRERAEPAPGFRSLAMAVVLVLLVAVVLGLGVLPSPVLALVR